MEPLELPWGQRGLIAHGLNSIGSVVFVNLIAEQE